MKKIRINELARELEVKPGVILDMLPDLGVQEKKTHSSSIDEDVALELRQRLVAEGSVRTAEERSNGNVYDSDHESDRESESIARTTPQDQPSARPEVVQEQPEPVVGAPAQVTESAKAAVQTPEPPAAVPAVFRNFRRDVMVWSEGLRPPDSPTRSFEMASWLSRHLSARKTYVTMTYG